MHTTFTTDESIKFRERIRAAAKHDPLVSAIFRLIQHELQVIDQENRRNAEGQQPSAATAYEELLDLAGLKEELTAFTPHV